MSLGNHRYISRIDDRFRDVVEAITLHLVNIRVDSRS